jgi:hypothetical protein
VLKDIQKDSGRGAKMRNRGKSKLEFKKNAISFRLERRSEISEYISPFVTFSLNASPVLKDIQKDSGRGAKMRNRRKSKLEFKKNAISFRLERRSEISEYISPFVTFSLNAYVRSSYAHLSRRF